MNRFNLNFRKKHILLLFLLMLISSLSMAQKGGFSSNSNNYPTIMIGPEFGGSIAFSMNSENELLTKFHYSLGGFIKVRPVHSFGLESGFKYSNIINTQKFYVVPLYFCLFSKNGGAFIVGPDFLYGIADGKTDFQKPKVGFTLGAGNQYAAVKFNYFPVNSDLVPDDNSKFYLGVGIYIQLSILSK